MSPDLLEASPPVRVVAGLLRRDGRVLLCHRRPGRTHYPDVWDFPGGHIEEGERTVDALVRELAEELGIIPEPVEGPPWMTLTADGLQLDVYLVDRWRGEPRNAAVDEHDAIRWVGVNELAELDLAHASYLPMLIGALA